MTPANPDEAKHSKKNSGDPSAHLLSKDCEL
jgi:hypothetical protein